MRTMILIVAACFPLTAGAALGDAVKSERALREECSYEISGVRECLEKKQKASEMDLKHAEEAVRNALSKWDEDDRFIDLAKARLAASGKVFARYREEQCAYASSMGGGAIGNALDMRRLACAAELNNRRAGQLHDSIADLPMK